MNKYLKFTIIMVLVIFPLLSYYFAFRGEKYQLEVIHSMIDKGSVDFAKIDSSAMSLNDMENKIHIAYIRTIEDKDKDAFLFKMNSEINRPDVLVLSVWQKDNLNQKNIDSPNISFYAYSTINDLKKKLKITNEVKSDNFIVLFNRDQHIIAYSDLDNDEQRDIFVKQLLYVLPPLKSQKFRKNRLD